MNDYIGLTFQDFCRMMGIQQTPAQVAITRIAFDGVGPEFVRHKDPSQDEVRTIFGDLPDGPVDQDVRSVFVAVCGARSGKSYLLIAARLLHLALTVDVSHLAAGENAFCIITAPDMRLGRQTLRYVSGMVNNRLKNLLVEENSDSVTIEVRGRRVTLETLPASAGGRSVRGRSLIAASMDEASFFRDSDSVINDDEIYQALAPRIVPGGQLLICSTPWSEAGLLFNFFDTNFGKPTTCLAAWAPTTLMRPDAKTAAMVKRERKRDPENARREFDAEFLNTSGSQFFDTRTVDAAFERWERERGTGYKPRATVVGADLAFTSDHTAFAAITEQDGTYRSQDYETLRPAKGAPLKPSDVMTKLVDFARRNYSETVWGDIHYQELVREHVSNAGLSFAEAPAGNEGKLDQYSKVRALLAEGHVSLKPEDGLREQLLGVTKRPLPGGGMQISQKRSKTGGHSDLASALILALWAAQHAGCGRIVPAGLPGWRHEIEDDDMEDGCKLGAEGSAYEL